MFSIFKKLRLKLNNLQDIEKLKDMGLKVGKNLSIQHGVLIDEHHCWHIKIGDSVTLAPNVHILAHDASTKKICEYVRIGKVEIEDNVFIGAGSIILPGVKIGSGSIVGAGSVVTRSIPSGVIVGGNPAKIISTIDEYKEKVEDEIEGGVVFEKEYTTSYGVTKAMKDEMNERLKDRFGYVK